MSALPIPIEVFYSYADADEPLCIELDKHLSQLRHNGLIITWHKRQIIAGTDRTKTLDQHLNTASVILLLISADFLASDYCYGIEMRRAMERHHTNEARIIPILLRPVDWHNAPFRRLQALPRNGRPVTSWTNHDEAFTDIVQGIRRVLWEIQHLASPHVSFPHNWNTSGKNEKREEAAKTEMTGRMHQIYNEQSTHMIHKTLDTDEVIRLFRGFLDASSTMRVLCIIGESKLGKTHLLTKVFPTLAQQEYQARHIVIVTLTRFCRVREEKSDKLYRGGHHGQDATQLYQRI